MRSNSWTPEEIEILKKYYPEEGARVVKRLPNRHCYELHFQGQ